jgi:hypothetical protein
MGIRTGEQRDVVTQFDESVGQMRYDAFGAAVQSRRHRLIERRDLSYFHEKPPRLAGNTNRARRINASQ